MCAGLSYSCCQQVAGASSFICLVTCAGHQGGTSTAALVYISSRFYSEVKGGRGLVFSPQFPTLTCRTPFCVHGLGSALGRDNQQKVGWCKKVHEAGREGPHRFSLGSDAFCDPRPLTATGAALRIRRPGIQKKLDSRQGIVSNKLYPVPFGQGQTQNT